MLSLAGNAPLKLMNLLAPTGPVQKGLQPGCPAPPLLQFPLQSPQAVGGEPHFENLCQMQLGSFTFMSVCILVP